MKRTLKILTLLAVMAVGAGQQAWADNSNKKIRLSAAPPEENYLTGVEFVDATGTATTTADGVKVYILDGTEETLGQDGTETWYICNNDLTYTNTHTIDYTTSSLTTYGKVNIIIADGKTLSVNIDDEIDSRGIEADGDLCLYGQSAATGKIFVKSCKSCINVSSSTSSYPSLTVTHCNIDVTNIVGSGIYADGGITIMGCANGSNTVKVNSNGNGFVSGAINITNCDIDVISSENYGIYVYASGNVTIDGGKVRVISQRDGYPGIYASNGDITLGWRKPGDFFQVSSYECGNGVMKTAANSVTGEETHVNRFEAFSVSGTGTEGDPFVETPFAYIEGNYTFTADQLTSLGGKKLVAAPEPVKYLMWDDTEKKLVETNTTDDNVSASDFLSVLQGTETTLGTAGEEMWYVALPGFVTPGHSGLSYEDPIELKGDVHLVLADGCYMNMLIGNTTGSIHGDASTSLTIYAQSDGQKKGKLETNPDWDGTAGIRAGTVTINGGQIDLSANPIHECYGIYADGGGLTFNGGEVRSFEKYGFFAKNCGITVNGGTVRAEEGENPAYGIYCETNGAHTIDINGGTVSAEGKEAAIWATNDVNIKSDVTAVCTDPDGYGIYSYDGDINISGGKVTADAGADGYYGLYAELGTVSITAGQVEVSGSPIGIVGYSGIFLSLSESTDFIKINNYFTYTGGMKIPAGQYLGVCDNGKISDEALGSADADYVFGAGSNATIDDIKGKTLVKATPIAGSGKYMPYDSSDGDRLLGDGTVALYPTGLKFTEKDDGSYTAEVILSDTPLAGIPQGKPVILTNKTVSEAIGTFYLMDSNANSGEGKTPDDLKNDYDGRTDRLANFIATDGKKTFLTLIGEATGETADQARDYLIYVLRNDRFMAVSFNGDDIPAQGHCLLVVPKWNLLRHIGLGTGADSDPSTARAIRLGGDGETTGIVNLTSDGDDTDATWYTLDGRKISTIPTHKGVFIRNGQKVVIK